MNKLNFLERQVFAYFLYFTLKGIGLCYSVLILHMYYTCTTYLKMKGLFKDKIDYRTVMFLHFYLRLMQKNLTIVSLRKIVSSFRLLMKILILIKEYNYLQILTFKGK